MQNDLKGIWVLWDGTARTRALSFTPSAPRYMMDLGIGLIMLNVGTSRNWRNQIYAIITTDTPRQPVQPVQNHSVSLQLSYLRHSLELSSVAEKILYLTS
jgi:hypothetical protein